MPTRERLADRFGHTRRKIETSALAWPFRPGPWRTANIVRFISSQKIREAKKRPLMPRRQVASQFGDFRQNRFSLIEAIGDRFHLFRSGNFFQAGLLAFNVNEHQSGGLCSTGITRRRHYYAPIRLPERPSYGYAFPKSVGRGRLIEATDLSIVRDLSSSRFNVQYPPFPTTPDRPTLANACCFSVDPRLHPHGEVGRDQRKSNEAERIHFRYG